MKIAFIGFGEAARAFTQTLRERGGLSFCAYDILLGSNAPKEQPLRDAAASLGVTLRDSAEAAVEDADWIVSAVTAADSLDAAKSVAAHLRQGQVFIDINSVSAGRKVESAALVEAGAAVYVDMAVMAPVHPRGHKTPVLLAGPACAGLAGTFEQLGFDFSIAGDEIGAATSIKMLRSLFVKGLEAITVQTLLAARAAGRFDEIYASLSTSFPQLGWPQFPLYQLERVTQHGVRRAAEMVESAATQGELDLPAGRELGLAIASVQRDIGSLGIRVDAKDGDLAAALDEVLAALRASL